MTDQVGTVVRPLRVAIIGAGPAGFYAAAALLQAKAVVVSVDMFDRLPTPHGLVRYGVAPDHQKIKAVSKAYDRTAMHPRFRFFGNITFGKDITQVDLRRYYDQIVYAVGAQADRKLNIAGEDLVGSLSATEFVAWYNGHPDFADLEIDLNGENAIVVGVGNVALDVARILAKSVEELQKTDITAYALAKLATSQIKDIYVLARRGPAQAKFTSAELKEFGELAIADVVVDAAELELDPLSATEVASDAEVRKNMEHLRAYATRALTDKPRRVHFCFLRSPVEILSGNGKVAAVRIEKNALRADAGGALNAHGTGEFATLPAHLILRSVGYKGLPLADVPYDTRTGTILNENGRVKTPETGAIVRGEYVVGWAKRGPTGVIGTNRPDAIETAQLMLEDLPQLSPALEPDPTAIEALLEERKLRFVTIDQWRMLDQIEMTNGAQQGKPRVKFVRIQDMLAALDAAVKLKL